MNMSQAGIDALLKKFEGCKLKAYRCPANVCTIGYGHTSAAGTPTVIDGMTITQKQADDILRQDLVKYETAVQGLVTQDLVLCASVGHGSIWSSAWRWRVARRKS